MLIFELRAIGNKLLAIRKKAGLTQSEVAEAANLSDRTYADIERGTVNMRIETGFVWSDLLTNLERVSDHCSNIAGCIIDMNMGNLNLHESLREIKSDKEKFVDKYESYSLKYNI